MAVAQATTEALLWHMLGSGADAPSTLDVLTRCMDEQFAMHAAVFATHDRGTRLDLAAGGARLPANLCAALTSRPVTASAEPALAAVAAREPVFTANLGAVSGAKSDRASASRRRQVASAWAHPLMSGQACVGALAVYGNEAKLPSPTQQRWLEKYAGIASLVLANARAAYAGNTREAEIRCVYDNVNDVLFSIRVTPQHEFHFQSANQRFLDATGLTRSDVIGAPIARVIPEPTLTLVAQHYEQAIRERRTVSWIETTPYPAGTKVGEVRVTPLFAPDGTCNRLIGSVHDITEQTELQERLTRASNLYAALSQCNQAIVQCTDQLQLFASVCRTTVEHGGMQFAWIGIRQPHSDTLKPVAFHGVGAEYIDAIEVSIDAAKPTGVGPGGTAYRTQQPVWS